MHLLSVPRAVRFARLSVVRLATTFAALLAVSHTGELSAQSAQRYSVQVAALTTSIGVGRSAVTTGGFGFEPQLRINSVASSESWGNISIGLGAQWTQHSAGPDDLTIAGAFVEPRWVIITPSTRVFPYLAGRLGLLQQSSNFGTSSSGAAIGGGAGLAIKLSPTVNLDLGGALVSQSFGDFTYTDGSGAVGSFNNPFLTYALKAGLSLGFPR